MTMQDTGRAGKDWQALFLAMQAVIDWSLDIAAGRSRGYPEYLDSVDNVRGFFHDWLAGRPAQVARADLLVTFATILAEIELDLGINSTAVLSPLLAAPTHVFRVPGIAADVEATVIQPAPDMHRCADPRRARTQAAVLPPHRRPRAPRVTREVFGHPIVPNVP